jgi:4-aminobutyrate aminotransferase / (S)-3-amino-2-methylpropionate transaminase / 5-aminovalerate transaminase
LVPAPGYLNALVAWCHDNGIVYVSDEVQSGMARTGAYFASEHFGIEPDFTTSAKGIGGGMPIAAVTGRAEIMDASHPGGLGGTLVETLCRALPSSLCLNSRLPQPPRRG